MGKAEADFGQGFYMAEDPSFAERMARHAVTNAKANAKRKENEVLRLIREKKPERMIQPARVQAKNLREIANTSQPVVLTFEMSKEDFEAFRVVGQRDYCDHARCTKVIQYYQ
jgi:hypothetical protein